MNLLTRLCLCILYFCIAPLNAQAPWTLADQAEYATKKANGSSWDLEMLQGDIDFLLEDDWPTKPAISDYPSPVPSYDWGYAYIANLEIDINGKSIKGHSVGFAKDKYRNHLLKDTADFYINYFNIFICTDLTSDEASANEVVSRNYPHYFSTGKQKTSLGSVDWMQMSLASGSNFAVVSQRYFNLDFGKTLLIIPLKDGSLRILQIDEEIGSLSSNEVIAAEKEGLQNPKHGYLKRLQKNPKVRAFFSNENALK